MFWWSRWGRGGQCNPKTKSFSHAYYQELQVRAEDRPRPSFLGLLSSIPAWLQLGEFWPLGRQNKEVFSCNRFPAVTWTSDHGSTMSKSIAADVFDERAPSSHQNRWEPSKNVSQSSQMGQESSSYVDKVVKDLSRPWLSNETSKADIR